MNKTTGTGDKSRYFWKEDFENFQVEEAERYHLGVTQYPFNTELYNKLMEELLAPYVEDQSQPLRILDAGGGTGKWTLYFANKGHNVTLLDAAKPMLEVAKKEVQKEGIEEKVTIHHGTIVQLPYEDETFDFIFSDRNPISHCGKKYQSYQSIGELWRVLKKGGTLLGCVLNRLRKMAQMTMELSIEKALSFIEEGELRRAENEYSHYYLIDELKEVLNRTGFQDIRLIPTTIFTELIPSAWLLDEIPIKKCYELEKLGRNYPELLSYGVRFHFLGKKP